MMQPKPRITRISGQIIEIMLHIARNRLDQLEQEIALPAERDLEMSVRLPAFARPGAHLRFDPDELADPMLCLHRGDGMFEVAGHIGVLEEAIQVHVALRAIID